MPIKGGIEALHINPKHFPLNPNEITNCCIIQWEAQAGGLIHFPSNQWINTTHKTIKLI